MMQKEEMYDYSYKKRVEAGYKTSELLKRYY